MQPEWTRRVDADRVGAARRNDAMERQMMGIGKRCESQGDCHRQAQRIIGLALSLLVAGSVTAGELQVLGQGPGPATGQFSVQLYNGGTQRLDGLRLHLPAGYQVHCPGATGQGRGFDLPQASLAAGDHVLCQATVPAQSAARAFAVSARTADGSVQVQTISASVRGTVTTPDQGFVVLIAGGVHEDTSGDGLLDAGESIHYHYTVLNAGTLPLSNLEVSDLAGVVSCPLTALAVGQSMICTRSYGISGADAALGEVINEIEVAGNDSLGRDVFGGDIVVRMNLQARAGITVFKSPLLLNDADGNGFPSVGDELRYQFVVKSNNAEDLTAVDLVEPDPDLIDSPISCQGTSLGGVPFTGLGTGALASMDTLVCEATYTIRPADGTAGQVVNLVQAQAEAFIAGPVNGTGASLVLLPVGESAVQVTKSVSPLTAQPGQTVVYTITVTNAGSVPLTDVQVLDPLPDGIASFSWTCAGALCPNAAGTGPIDELIPDFPIGALLTYTVQAVLNANPPSPIVNLVSVSPDGITVCAPSGAPPPCQADAEVGVVGPPPPPAPVPLNNPWLLGLMALGLWLLGRGAARRRPQA